MPPLKNQQKERPPVNDRGQVNREASRLGDAGVIDPLPTPKSRNTGGDTAVFDGKTVMVQCGAFHPQKPDAAMLLTHAPPITHAIARELVKRRQPCQQEIPEHRDPLRVP